MVCGSQVYQHIVIHKSRRVALKISKESLVGRAYVAAGLGDSKKLRSEFFNYEYEWSTHIRIRVRGDW